MKRLIAVFIVLTLVVGVSIAYSADYYVSSDGSDVTGDGSKTNSWMSISYALEQITAGPENPQIIEVTPRKKVVWTFQDFEIFGNSLPVVVLPGE